MPTHMENQASQDGADIALSSLFQFDLEGRQKAVNTMQFQSLEQCLILSVQFQ